MPQCLLDDLLWRIAKGLNLLRSGLRDVPVMAMLTPEVARCRVDADVLMARDHVIHRLQLDGIDLKAARPSVDQASEYPRPIFPITTEPPPSFRYEALAKAESATNGIILAPFVKQSLPIKAFPRRRSDFLRPDGGREEMGARAPKEAAEERFLQKGTAVQPPVHIPSMGKLQNPHFPFTMFISRISKCVRWMILRLQEGQKVELYIWPGTFPM